MARNRKHIRLRNYDYASDGWYFVTICTKNRECYFGVGRDVACNVPTCNVPTETDDHNPMVVKNEYMASISPKPGTLSAIVRSFKSALTKWCNDNHIPNFAWQSRFHDHIIRNQVEFERIENYIVSNVENWESDKFFR